KRKHVGGLVFVTKAMIQRTKFVAAGERHVQRSVKISLFAGSTHEPGQRRIAQAGKTFANYDQAFHSIKTNRRPLTASASGCFLFFDEGSRGRLSQRLRADRFSISGRP